MGAILLIFPWLFSCQSGLAGAVSWDEPWDSVPQLLRLLDSVPSGSELLARARARDPAFEDHIQTGRASYTESTLSRSYSLVDGREQVRIRQQITIGSSLSLADAVADLAHELVHYSEKTMLDPYKAGFELVPYVRNGIEGRGGELDALRMECAIAQSLRAMDPKFPSHTLCARYLTPSGEFQADRARRDYYAVSRFESELPPELKRRLPEISRGQVLFSSSFAGKPYPVALSEEFNATRKAACANNRRKYRLITSRSSGASRSPSAEDLLLIERKRLQQFEKSNCREQPEGID